MSFLFVLGFFCFTMISPSCLSILASQDFYLFVFPSSTQLFILNLIKKKLAKGHKREIFVKQKKIKEIDLEIQKKRRYELT